MSFVETDILGVYVAPISIMMVFAYAVLFGLRKAAVRLGWFDLLWHPGLFELALYMIILSATVLTVGALHAHV